MKLWRVSPATDLSSACTSESAGRWSWASRDVLYTSSTPELAALEALAHREENEATHWLSLVVVPEAAQLRRVSGLPPDWVRDKPATRAIGNRWYDSKRSAGLVVPSALCTEASNVLINPCHPQTRGMRMILVRRFDFDRRLLRGK